MRRPGSEPHSHRSCRGGLGVGALTSAKAFIYSKIKNPSHGILCPLYIAEISPPDVRGSLMALEQLSIVLGASDRLGKSFLYLSFFDLMLSMPVIRQETPSIKFEVILG